MRSNSSFAIKSLGAFGSFSANAAHGLTEAPKRRFAAGSDEFSALMAGEFGNASGTHRGDGNG
jgi:hypothetical protein